MSVEHIVVYVSNQCKESDKVIRLLEEMAVNFEKKNISENKAYLKELQRLNIYATPAIIINDKKVLGFQKRKIEQLIYQCK
ncbi:glutaredoxin family protein [Amphibacillus cookii]|uniref:glutaredoxin family protein n=1 Tax=Amphibacillus cookii TaxID=767787 RepID=UPI001955FD8F|nr:glutaredoxin family protein [Amphibacillus cookii]MBM7542904.1 glutaredoxin [Amphibacillus cookii]